MDELWVTRQVLTSATVSLMMMTRKGRAATIVTFWGSDKAFLPPTSSMIAATAPRGVSQTMGFFVGRGCPSGERAHDDRRGVVLETKKIATRSMTTIAVVGQGKVARIAKSEPSGVDRPATSWPCAAGDAGATEDGE